MNCRILLAGVGGQGVLFAHNVLADCALALGLDVTGAETHGMSQRGGAVVSHLKIGDTTAPLIRQGSADFVIAFDPTEAYRSLPFLRRGGTLIVNTPPGAFPDPRVAAQLEEYAITAQLCDADAIARELGRGSAANVALLGFASTCHGFPFDGDALRAAVRRVAHPRYAELNERAFDAGTRAGVSNRERREMGETHERVR